MRLGGDGERPIEVDRVGDPADARAARRSAPCGMHRVGDPLPAHYLLGRPDARVSG